MDPLLDQLDSPTNEAPHDSNAIHFIFLHLLHFLTQGCGAPGLLHHQSVPDIRRQGRIWIGSVEPSVVPTLQRSFEGEAHILCTSPLMKLETGSPNYANLPPFLSWFEDKKMAEQSKMGLDAKESFAQMDEGGNVEDRVGVQIHQLNPIKMKKTSEEFTGWQNPR